MYQPHSGDVIGLASGSAGVVWELRTSFYWEGSGSEVLRTDGHLQMRIPLAGKAGGMVADGDGGVWVTLASPVLVEGSTDASGRTTYTLTGSGSRVAHVAADGSVAEIAVRDQVNKLGFPDIVRELGPIALGADGNLWLVESGITSPPPYEGKSQPPSMRLVRLTPAGAVRSWPMGVRVIRGLAAGPGGIWFTADEGTIGRVDYSGRVVRFSDPLARAEPGEIVAGPRNSMWFTEWRVNALASIDSRGVVRQHTWGRSLMRGNDYAGAIADGSDGTLWVYRPYLNDLGHLSLRSQCAVPRLIGMPLPRAVRRLRHAGCRPGTIAGRQGRRRGRLIVVAQHPLAGELKALGTKVGVRVQPTRAAHLGCVPADGQREVARDAEAVVLTKLMRQGLVDFRVCRFGHGSMEFGYSETGEDRPVIEMPTLAGPYLAWRTARGDRYDESSETVTLLNVETGRKSSFVISLGEADLVNEIAVDTRGHLAWQRSANYTSNKWTYEIQACTPGGVVTLETSSGALLEGLRFDGTGDLTWVNGSVEHSFTFPPSASC